MPLLQPFLLMYGATWEQQVVSSQSEYWCSRLSSTTWKILTIFKLGSIASSVESVVYEVVQARKGSMLLAFAMLYPFAVPLGRNLAWYDLELLKSNNLIACGFVFSFT
ncbi:uncharacterized protein LOC111801844 isoform X3 [Cucurbita pepo subsp. pepo]|uniref:uncharacterized protein LOC111801844 isoform X3 n=1 Tax=Cucurbita pepo subsp. pepo TaxID=3664 RepID=UPI000C9D5FE9|nr:uncharacterized protein LOC111801844 isoform X3 [Cucurbita pepo subsp. pepo]